MGALLPSRGSVLPILLALAMAAHAQTLAPASPPATDSSAAREKLLEDWDQKQHKLQQSIWQTYAATAALGKDARGKTLADDFSEWVMTAGVRAQLQAVRAQAQRLLQAGDEPGARAALGTGEAAIDEQTRRVSLIDRYRWGLLQLDRPRALWQRWVAEAPDSLARPSRARISQLEAALGDFSVHMTFSDLGYRLEKLRQGYNEERLSLAGELSQQQVAAGAVILARDPSLPCPQAPADTRPPAESSAPGPSADIRVARFYPSATRLAGISGRVVLKLTIAADGCLEHAEVNRSSGAPELDEAAIDAAEHMSYFAARQNGHFVDGSFLTTFNFESDLSSAASGDARRAARELLSRGDFDGAIKGLDALIAKDPDDASALADRGTAHLDKYENELAHTDFDRALTLDPRNFIARRGLAFLAVRARDFSKAVTAFTSALELQPNDLYCLQWRANVTRRSGDADQAIAYYAEAIKSHPAIPALYLYRANMLRAQHKDEEAVGQAEAVIKANPVNAAAYSTAGSIYAYSGKDAEARRAFDQAVSLSPSESTYLQRAAFRARSDRTGRKEDIDAAIALNPRSTQALLALIDWQSDAGDHAKVVETATQALSINGDANIFLIRRGIAFLMAHQEAQAEKDLTEARTRARTATALNTFCWALATANVALDRALSACEAAVAIAPLEGSYLDSRAFVLLRLGRYAEARKSYDEALKSDPFLLASLYGRGLVHLRQGNKAAADKDFRAALAEDARVAERFASYGLRPEG
jgi:TonB family protein